MAKMVQINVDASEMSVLTQRMRKLHRSALPVAVRNTLNNAAFYDKKTALPASAQKNFPKSKSKTFFKKFSGVQKASGFNINTMHSKMGMLDLGKRSARDAIENMTKQEKGGTINDGFAYLKEARGGKENGSVRKKNYYDKSKVISGRSKAGRNKGSNKSKFIARAARAFKEKKPMFFNSMKGNFLVTVHTFRKKDRNTPIIKFKLLMKERAHKPAKIKATNFAEEAGLKSQKQIPELYKIEAEKQFNRIRK